MTAPDTLLLLSGGIDSAFCMWRALLEGRRLHVHHVHLTNYEGRLHYEARAVERILEWMRGQGLDSFRYTESAFDYGTLPFVVKDHCVWALMIGIVCADPRNRGITRVIRPDHWDSLPGGPSDPGMKRAHRRYRNIAYEVCEREIVFEHPIQHMKKAEVIKAMPLDLLECCWWCRKPTPDGKPCHKCYTCSLVDPVLEGARPMLEAKVIHKFKCKHTRRVYEVGDVYRHTSEARMIELANLETPRIAWPPITEDERPDDADSGEQIDGLGLDPVVQMADPEKPLEELPYRELQERAKEKGIKANQGRDDLIAALKSE